MSLNGLDDPKLVEAYEGAISEAGGWFLLKYQGRDEVQVLSRGSGGIGELRNAIAEYDETSPLYGFLKYRRRSVIIKYLPENCTRIIQARVAVHLNAICERFSPFDTIFEITTASELKDSKLSAACSLHTASCSTSSSTSSLRRRRLMEIAEEEEDDQRATKRQSIDVADENRPQTAGDGPSTAEPVSLNSDLASSPEQSKFAAATTSDVPPFVGVDDHRTSMDSDTITLGSYPYSKPKVKLGPRPSVDANPRPQAAGNFRPVSLIPAGFKLFGRSGKKGKGKDASSTSSPQDEMAEAPISTSDDSQDRPTTSSSSVVDSASVPVPVQKKPAISPEKARLMKAMQLREKNKKLSVLPSSDNTVADDDLTQVSDETILSSESDCDKINRDRSLSKDDSGVGLEPPPMSVTHADLTSELTASDSHPASSLIGSSDGADQSTKASSISESTDETVQAKEEEADSKDALDFDASAEDESKRIQVNAQPLVDTQNAAQTAETAENKDDDETKGAITTIAGLSTASQIAEDPKEGSIDDGESFENVALPVSKFSATTASGPDESGSRSTETADIVAKNMENTDTTDPPPDLKTKVSVQHLWAATKAASQPTVPAVAPAIADIGVAKNDKKISSHGTGEEAADLSNVTTEQSKRRSQIEPIKTTNLEQRKEPDRDTQTAPLEQATPVVSNQTPTTPSFHTPSSTTTKGQDVHGSASSSPHVPRAVSNPIRGNLSVPSDVNPSSPRSLSTGAAYLNHVNQHQQGANLAKKSNNLGSSISQRIKALEKLSSATGDVPAVTVRDRPSSTFFAVKKRDPPKSPFVLDRANSFRSQTTTSSPAEESQEAVPSEEGKRNNRLDRSESVTNRLSMFEYSTTGSAPRTLGVPGSGNNARGRPESVSVMARIIRDTNGGGTGQSSFEPPRDPSEYKHLELKQSPLMVDLQSAITADKNDGGTVEQRTQVGGNEVDEQSKVSKSRQSLSIVKGFIKERRKSASSDAGNSPGGAESVVHANPVSPAITTVSSTRSSFSKDRDAESALAADDAKSTSSDKKLSRAGRFMRRLSNISSTRSKISPPPTAAAPKKEGTLEPEPAQLRPSTTGTPTIVSYMGDVNVQFPDNLLWKRRNMSLDSQGFLILSALPVQSGRSAQGTKRYHLGDFRTPYIPDVEVQELPNSVVLDFIEGSGLQVACEDRAEQLRVLQTLREAHATRGTTYGL
ncbi:hypothetical protein E4U55_000830 [Claviceps digitariae]|nr:hypothetical protein E4U55_000830 [Claviceps digitariae]